MYARTYISLMKNPNCGSTPQYCLKMSRLRWKPRWDKMYCQHTQGSICSRKDIWLSFITFHAETNCFPKISTCITTRMVKMTQRQNVTTTEKRTENLSQSYIQLQDPYIKVHSLKAAVPDLSFVWLKSRQISSALITRLDFIGWYFGPSQIYGYGLICCPILQTMMTLWKKIADKEKRFFVQNFATCLFPFIDLRQLNRNNKNLTYTQNGSTTYNNNLYTCTVYLPKCFTLSKIFRICSKHPVSVGLYCKFVS